MRFLVDERVGASVVRWLRENNNDASSAYEDCRVWSEPLRVDNELSNGNSWRESYEKDQTALRPRIQDISSSRA